MVEHPVPGRDESLAVDHRQRFLDRLGQREQPVGGSEHLVDGRLDGVPGDDEEPDLGTGGVDRLDELDRRIGGRCRTVGDAEMSTIGGAATTTVCRSTAGL